MSDRCPPPAEHLAAEMAARDQPAHAFGFEFTGSAAEYFRVWIVNIALSILTLGVYSAWAKVRSKQYFYGNSHLAGSSFEYTANPVNILKGRLIVFAAFLAYNLGFHFDPTLSGVLVLLLLPLLPWMVVNAVRFNLRHSAYRNLRFHFDAGYWEAFRVYLLWSIGIVLSFGLAYPFAAWRRKRFLVEPARYGNGGFSYHAEAGRFYLIYILAGLVFAAVVGVFLLLLGGLGAVLSTVTGVEAAVDADVADTPPGALLYLLMAIGYAGFLAFFIALNAAIQAAISSYVWSSTRLEDIRFRLDLSLARITWLHATNLLAIIASVGLLIPWAKVRMVRYQLSRFTMLASPEALARFVASQREYVTATGDEFGEAFDLDLGL